MKITLSKFCRKKSAILLCTNNAEKDLDIPTVDMIIQYDPPDDPDEYILRMGKIVRKQKSNIRIILVLLPGELKILESFKQLNLSLREFRF